MTSRKNIKKKTILMGWTLPSTGMGRARYLPSLIALFWYYFVLLWLQLHDCVLSFELNYYLYYCSCISVYDVIWAYWQLYDCNCMSMYDISWAYLELVWLPGPLWLLFGRSCWRWNIVPVISTVEYDSLGMRSRSKNHLCWTISENISNTFQFNFSSCYIFIFM